MAHGPETRFIQGVHRFLLEDVYREKMHNPYRGGTPDMYYEGNKGIIWVEYKWLDWTPKILNPEESGLTALQTLWLRRAAGNGIPTAVVFGLPKGGVIFENLTWEGSIAKAEIEKTIKPKKEVALWIRRQVCRPKRQKKK